MFRQITAYKNDQVTLKDCGNFSDQYSLQQCAVKLAQDNDKVIVQDMQGNECLVLEKIKSIN